MADPYSGVQYFPQTIPGATVIGRLASTPGATEAIPLSALAGLFTPISNYTTAALLLAFPAAALLNDGTSILTTGFSTEGDGGGAQFFYKASDTTTADNGGTIRVDTAGRRWYAITPFYITPNLYGAFPGAGDATAAISAANNWANPYGPSGVLMLTGQYTVSGNLTLNNPIVFAQGASISIAANKVVTLNNQIEAPVQQIFAGAGTVTVQGNGASPDLQNGLSLVGYPEWFGAQQGNIAFDNTAAINACIKAFPITQFQRATYYHAGTILCTTPGRKVIGFPGRNPADIGTTTAKTVGTGHCWLIGAASSPGGINTYINNVYLEGFYATRSVGPVPNASDDITNPTTFLFQYCLNCYADRVLGDGSSHAWGFNNVVNSYINQCTGRIVTAGTGPHDDVFSGFFLNGELTGNTGIASLVISQCNVQYNASGKVNPIGMTILGGTSDLWVDQFEADGIEYGVYINGSGGSKPIIDCFISGGVFDGMPGWGIFVTSLPAGSNLLLEKNYISPVGGAAACIEITNCNGNVAVIGNQGTGLGSGGDTVVGLLVTGSINVQSVGNRWTDLLKGTQLITVSTSSFEDIIANNVKGGGGTAMSLATNCTSCYIRPTISMGSGLGVACDSSTVNCEVNTSAITKGGSTTGALYYNGSHVTSVGTFGSGNIASGVI